MHLFFLALSVAAVLVILVALVLCFKAPAPKYKWLWAPFVVLGLVQVSLEPASGSYTVTAVHIAFPGARFLRDEPSAPPQPTVVIPFGALVLLARRGLRGSRG